MGIEQAKAYGKVVVLMGGDNCEREVSLQSGGEVMRGLVEMGIDAVTFDPSKDDLNQLSPAYFDRAFNALHGEKYEDGQLQGFLQTVGLPSTGPSVLCSAICMNKIVSKRLLAQAEVPVIPYALVSAPDDISKAAELFGLPLCVKPNGQGSSRGVSKVTKADQFESAFKAASVYGDAVLAEHWVDGREIAIGVLDGVASPIVEIIPQGEFYDYNAKYVDETAFPCPLDVSEEMTKTIKTLAVKAANALMCTGVVRVDMILDKTNQLWLLEVNTLPGMTSHSLVPRSFRHNGIDFNQLLLTILDRTLGE